MARVAVAEATLSLARATWGELVRRREQGRGRRPSEEKVRAAGKAMQRADEALSRALADLRAALPPVERKSKAELAEEHERAEFERVVRASTTPRLPRPAPLHPDSAPSSGGLYITTMKPRTRVLAPDRSPNP